MSDGRELQATGPLLNARHERFAQELVKGKTADEAYVLAGFTPNRGNAARLKANESIMRRVLELLGQSAARTEITQARVLEEFGKIAFADIRKAVRWRSNVAVAAVDERDPDEIFEEEGELDGEVRHAITNQVELIDSDAIDDDTAAAISEVSMTDKGSLKVKFHDKQAALLNLGRYLGMFTDKLDVTSDGERLPESVIAIRVAALFEAARQRAKEAGDGIAA